MRGYTKIKKMKKETLIEPIIYYEIIGDIIAVKIFNGDKIDNYTIDADDFSSWINKNYDYDNITLDYFDEELKIINQIKTYIQCKKLKNC